MRKQTKLAAVVSAAALLAIGASMTSFAATGWVEEDGQWYFYDKDGVRVEDEWKKSGDNWYWMDSEEDGAMATDKLIEDDDDTYYVDSNGVMVRNTWVKVVNEEQDDDDDPAEYHYYYMQSSGKAYKNTGDTSKVRKKTIDGKQYAFDEDGVMLYGWVGEDGTRLTGDTGWSDEDGNVYYFGGWEDGSMKTGWQRISVFDEEKDDDYDYWFNFKSNGQLRKGTEAKKLNGKYYRFDDRGVMVYQWSMKASGSEQTPSDWSYFNSPEDGARVTKGWFKVVAPNEDNSFLESDASFDKDKAEDESEKWYYADGDGELYAGEIKKIKGKYYGFAPTGYMLTGLCYLDIDGSSIDNVYENDMDSDTLDDIIDGNHKNKDGKIYYFGSNEDSDGAMKSGSTTISLDGSNYQFFFNNKGGAESRGYGITGIYDGKYIYQMGKRLKADSDEKYVLAFATDDYASEGVEAFKVSDKNLRKANPEVDGDATLTQDTDVNKDKDTVKAITGFTDNYYLINTSGAIQKGTKTGTKDGNDWYWYLNDGHIKMYTNNKSLSKTKWDNNAWKNIVTAGVNK
ncbi:argininosuccinate lyase [Clostridium sp. AN503]|uniref:argininosuccinate lyase n=1 Tax=Clostridium sp. AN503 TaxID=3160598 RepID=UPI0034593321